MRKQFWLLLFVFTFLGLLAEAQQKEYGWLPENGNTFRLGPGYHNGVAVFQPQGWEAIRIHMDIEARHPVSIAVVPLNDWNNAVQHPEQVDKLDYACLMENVVQANFSCNFYASYTSRVVVVRDMRHAERLHVTGVGSTFVRAAVDEWLANEVRVTPYHWGCTANCDLPDPPQYAWVDLRKEKYEITSSPKSYGPFTPEKDNDKVRIRVKTPFPMTVAMVASSLVDELYAHRDQATEILSKISCKQYGVQKTTFDCTLQKTDGDQQVVLLPEVEINKKKKAEIEISTVKCVANCTQ